MEHRQRHPVQVEAEEPQLLVRAEEPVVEPHVPEQPDVRLVVEQRERDDHLLQRPV